MNKDFEGIIWNDEGIIWNDLYETQNVNKALTIFGTIVKRLFDKHAPVTVKRVKGKPCQWLTSDLKKLMSDRDRVLEKARKSDKDKDWNNYKKLRNSCNNQTRAAKRKYHRNILNEHARSPKGFWKCIKSIFPTKSASSAEGNNNINQTFVNKCSEYYQNAVSTLNRKAMLLKDFVWRMKATLRRTNFVFEFDYVSILFIQKELRSLKRNKASGVDGFPPSMLKDSRMHISQPLCQNT